MSLKNLDKQYAQRRQTYRAVLDNPFTNEGSLWPHVKDQQQVWELIQTILLARCRALADAEVPAPEWPLGITTSFNEIVTLLQHENDDNDQSNRSPLLLLVCNKDHGVSSVVLQQIPLLAYMSPRKVTLVQLPRGALATIQTQLKSDCTEGLLLAWGDELQSLVNQITAKIDQPQLPWLDQVKFEPTALKLLKTTAPLKKPVEKAGKK
ncbi:hypothetical protein ZYGR_0H01240 [Zygosaccharomyces rouxii]|uniref:ZYRO0B06798p n=2 Tax=Zygosaccharomyces rouxii TaxID=4956 RepID=C5DRA4_ZYGRC|nr:uncharacterized protein ZYRO0B06798g [Zygosaccharomyces rouxii]KAH9200141.1 RNase P, subunit Pop3 [Zygosaccharomyces rouxii]GAV47283.1 hypothetical protein ZYGR_0H01240 [Zygosaccharomyces rouxii]CAR26315.1 ZYRO0B06798p [Zygosaccharomyces rouxii]